MGPMCDPHCLSRCVVPPCHHSRHVLYTCPPSGVSQATVLRRPSTITLNPVSHASRARQVQRLQTACIFTVCPSAHLVMHSAQILKIYRGSHVIDNADVSSCRSCGITRVHEHVTHVRPATLVEPTSTTSHNHGHLIFAVKNEQQAKLA